MGKLRQMGQARRRFLQSHCATQQNVSRAGAQVHRCKAHVHLSMQVTPGRSCNHLAIRGLIPLIAMQLERQLRLANARYKELQHEINSMRVQMAESGKQSISEETKDYPEPAKSDGAVGPEECPVHVPQPAEDRCLALLHPQRSLKFASLS